MVSLYFVIVFVVISESYAATSAGCMKQRADVVFLLDASYSETKTNFDKQLEFVKNFSQSYDIGPNNVQVSVVTFSTSAHNGFYLNKYHDKASLLNGIQHVAYTPGGTNTDAALRYVRQTSFQPAHGGRYGVPKILVVLTDGQSSLPSATATEAKILHYSDVTVIAVGIGSQVRSTELNAIATDTNHAFIVPSFDSLHTIAGELQNVACSSENKDLVTCDSKAADIVFLLDSSGSEGHTNFNKQLYFVSNVTDNFQIGPKNIQVSLVTFGSHTYNEFSLNAYHDKKTMQNAIQTVHYHGGTTNTASALRFIRDYSFKPVNGGRGNSVTRLVVVLTDGNSNSKSQTITEATLLHYTGVKVISVGIGSSVARDELEQIASDASYVFTVANFTVLPTIQRELEVAACTTPSECGAKPTDLVFIVDSSTSEGPVNFQKELDFMTDFVNEFDIGPSDVQVSLVTFSTAAHSQFHLNTYSDKADLIAAIQSVQFQGGDSAIDEGLHYARYFHLTSGNGGRPNASMVLIVMTDGHSVNSMKAIQESLILKNAGVKIIAIGVGQGVDSYEINGIASDHNTAFAVGSYDILHTLQPDIKAKACGGVSNKPTTTLACGNQKADIVFVLDSSASEGSVNFHKQLSFVRDFVYQFTIGPSAVQVSVVVFSSGVYEIFPLNKYHDRTSLVTAIAKITYRSGVTNTDKALAYVRQNSFLPAKGARTDAVDLVIVITDGQSTHPTYTQREAYLLKNSTDARVITLGIGAAVTRTELLTIASDPSHALNVDNFNALESIKAELTYATCDTCNFLTKADIVFVLDSSQSEGSMNFQKMLDFVSRFENDFEIGPDKVQIGVVTFSDYPSLEFKLNTYSTKAAVLSATQRIGYSPGGTRADLALKYVRMNMFSILNGARDGAKNFVVYITDGVSTNTTKTLAEAHLIKQQKIDIMAVGVGPAVHKNELTGMATDSNHVFTVPTFDDLQSIRQNIKRAACDGATKP